MIEHQIDYEKEYAEYEVSKDWERTRKRRRMQFARTCANCGPYLCLIGDYLILTASITNILSINYRWNLDRIWTLYMV